MTRIPKNRLGFRGADNQVRFLLEKEYPKENIDFEREIIKYGYSGRNSLGADIVKLGLRPNINTNKDKLGPRLYSGEAPVRTSAASPPTK